VLDHLGPLRRLLPPATPRPPDPALSLAHPQQHLPPAPAPTAQAPQPQKAARHAPPHHAPPPARAAQSCATPRRIAAPALPQPRSVTGFLHNVPGSLKGVGTGLLGLPKMLWDTGGDIGTSLSDGVSAAYHRAHGEKDLADAEDQEAKHADDRTREKLLNLVPFGGSDGGIAHYAEAGGDWAASLGQSPEVAAVMRQEGGAALHRANGYMADMAYQDPAGFALNLLPLAGRAAALSRLGKVADATEAASREAAAAGDAARASQLSERAARYRQAISLARGGKAGAAVREARAGAARKLSAGGKASLAKGRAAVGKYRERRAGGDKAAGVRDAGDPLAPHTPGSLARGQAAAAGMRGKWHDQAHGRPAGQGQPALAHAGGGGGGATTHPIGKPGVMKMVGGEASSDAVPRLKANGEFDDPVLEAQYQKYVRSNPARGRTVRDRLAWKREREQWAISPAARGNAFNKTVNARKLYPYSEVHLRNGTYVDGYRPPRGSKPGEIVSRKAIDFDDYSESDLRTHLREFNTKYQPGTEITTKKYPELYGDNLSGRKILEVPETNQTSTNRQRFENIAQEYGIEIRYTPEH